MTTEKSLGFIKVLLLIVCLDISLTWNCRSTQAAIYRHTGLCKYNNELFEAGQTFFRGCDKCYCYNNGYICFPPTTPTSWPKKCQRVPTACGFKVVYRDNPAVECLAYSQIW